jgi:uncharacterized repeat protein (TIGR01451 family)
MNQHYIKAVHARASRGHEQILFFLFALTILCWNAAAWAAPAAGTQIGNQASATYTDNSQTTRTVTSNTVTTVVQQVASLTLSANGAKSVTPGGQVAYPHTLTNTGNGTDSFALSASNAGSFGLSSVTFYADANGDGIPDNATPITGTGEVAAGGSFRFVAVGNVPGTAVSGNTNTLTVSVASGFTPAVTASNTDTSTVTSNAVINVTKAIDVGSGASPSGPRTFTLTYTNTGNSTASNVSLLDALPSGMTYVANSARWSATGSTVLTDASNTDNQSGIVYDFGVTAPNRITAVIAAVGPGVTGTLTFQANINSGLAPGANAATANTASYSYNDGVSAVAASNTNTVQFTVAQSAAVTLTGATVAAVPQGGTVSFANTLVNGGNGTDSFDIAIGANTFPTGTSFTLYQADGVTPMVDSNGNGVPDTGPLAAGASYSVVVKATLPAGASGGPYTVQKTATSRFDASKSATVTDTLTAITANTVDLTNNAAGAGAPGAGAGPESAAVITNAANPGSTSRFTLYVGNSSAVADTFNLQASTDSTFATASLPAGWSVVFKDASGAVISNTGVIAAGGSKLVYADVTVPAGYAAGAVDVYFRTASPTSGAADRLHDAVSVNTVRAITLTPNHSGQIYAGGSVVYSHTVSNNGNVTEGDGVASTVALTLADSLSGFSSVVYWDKNNDGVLDASDPIVASLAALTGGSNGASTAAGLSPGESATLFVKVFAPSGAAAGAVDTATLSATTSGVINGVAAPAAAVATDSTTVVAGQVNLVKAQALDAACDGTPDTAYGTGNISSGAIPGACVRYQITATNVGAANVSSVVVSDATPANTTYTSAGPAATTAGTVTAPANGASGTIQASVGTLTPGQSAVITFGVRINP